jgi:hypothetical protein
MHPSRISARSAWVTSREPPLFDRGNIARSLFYMATRYTGDAANEPALVLTDNTALIQSTNAYMGKLSTLSKALPAIHDVVQKEVLANWQKFILEAYQSAEKLVDFIKGWLDGAKELPAAGNLKANLEHNREHAGTLADLAETLLLMPRANHLTANK